jgi:hypothetical protein
MLFLLLLFIPAIYLTIFLAFFLLGGVIYFIPRLRKYSGYIWSGTAGTLPGILWYNILYSLFPLVLAFGFILYKRGDFLISNAIINSNIWGGIMIALIIGFILANIIGCGVGFIGGALLYKKYIRQRTSPLRQMK